MSKTKKKLYKKPDVKQVKLIPEEAVLSNCKNTNAGMLSKDTRCRTTGYGCANRVIGS